MQNLPELIAKLDRTLASLEEASKNANGMIGDNRAADLRVRQNGLGQVGPDAAPSCACWCATCAASVRRLDRNPAGYATGRTHPEEFTPNESK